MTCKVCESMKHVSVFVLVCLLFVVLFVVPGAHSAPIEQALDLDNADTVDWSPALERLGGETQSIEPGNSDLTIGVFWASWCGPCREEFPQLRSLHHDFSDSGFRVIGINVEESRQKAQAFLEKYPANFPVYLDKDRSIHKQFDEAEFYVLPAGFVLKGSTLVGTFQGARRFESKSVRAAIRRELSESKHGD